jgi:hypothetical protein
VIDQRGRKVREGSAALRLFNASIEKQPLNDDGFGTFDDNGGRDS